MKRIGHCNHCGFCCEYAILATFPSGKKLSKDEEKYLLRFDASAVEIGNALYLVIKHPCKFYDAISRKCADHPNRPTLCRKFPQDPNNPYLLIMEKWGVKCGYSFVEDE